MKIMKMPIDLGNDILLLDFNGYNDGCYWDARYLFKYKDKYFVHINTGSYSGYIPIYGGICYADKDQINLSQYLKDWDKELNVFADESCIPETKDEKEDMAKTLISYADKLMGSKENEIELWSE